eukprot:6052777-Prymnesium_polylepis.2
MSARTLRTRTATAELERLASRSHALRRRSEYQSQHVQALNLRICRRQSHSRSRVCVRLLTSSRSAPGVVVKVARLTALHVLRHDADRTVCMAV